MKTAEFTTDVLFGIYHRVERVQMCTPGYEQAHAYLIVLFLLDSLYMCIVQRLTEATSLLLLMGSSHLMRCIVHTRCTAVAC